MWQYLYFLQYLANKEVDNYSGQESYVAEKIKRRDLSFFPLGQAISLKELNKSEDKINELTQQIHRMVQKIENLEHLLERKLH